MTAPLLEQAVCLTQEMLASAQREDWDSLALQQDQRHAVLARAEQAGERHLEHVRTMLDVNAQIGSVVERARDQVAEQWQQARDRSQAIAAYSAF